MSIFSIGDGHSIFYHNSKYIKEHWVAFAKLPLTWYGLIEEKIDIYNIGNLLGNGHEKYNIKDGDYVLFSYGYSDIQKKKYVSENFKEKIEKLIKNFIDLLIELKEKYKIIPIVQCLYPNPRKESKNIKGTFVERKKYTEFANQILKKNRMNLTFCFLIFIIL